MSKNDSNGWKCTIDEDYVVGAPDEASGSAIGINDTIPEKDEQEDLDVILKLITSGLTGNVQQDGKYLMEQMEAYKSHELSSEIIRACGRLLYDILPNETKDEIGLAIEKDSLGMEATLEEARFNIYKKDWKKAQKILEDFIRKFEALDLFHDDSASSYFDFDELFEMLLYSFRYKPKKEIRRAEMPLSEVYYLYGAILVELQQFEAAKNALKKALRWNPMSCRNNFEYAEVFKMTGDYETFFKLTLDIFKMSFNKLDIARCYRNLGFYFIEKNQYDKATACYYMSSSFEPDSKQAMSELYYISTKTGKNPSNPSLNELQQYAEEYGFPIGADEDVIGLSYAYGKHSLDNGEYDHAAYFWRIAYELTDDEEVGAKLKEIENRLN